MARSKSDIDKIVSNSLNKKNKKVNDEKINTSTSIDKIVDTSFAKKTINFDTLQSDLTNLSQTIGNIYNGWQTKETMQNTLSSVQSMYDRLGKYQEYQKKYGGTDLSELQGNFKSLIDEWDILSNEYGRYKNADAYNAAKKISLLDRDYTGLTFDEVQAKKKEFPEDSFEYKYFDNYTKYTDLKEFDKAIKDLKNKKSGSNIKTSDGLKFDNSNKTLQIKPLGTDLTEGLKNPQVDEALRKSAEEAINSPNKESYYEKIAFEGRDLETERNKWKLDHAFDLYKDVMQNEDFAETSKYVSTKNDYGNPLEKLTKGKYSLGYGDLTYEFINNVDGMQDTIKMHEKAQTGRSTMEEKGYHKLEPNEVSVYNSLYKYDKENGTNKAQKFLDDMEITLSKRVYDEKTKTWKSNSESPVGATISSILSVPASVLGSIPTLTETIYDGLQGKEYNPYSAAKTFTNYAQDTRKYVGENIEEATEGMEVFGQNIPSFLYSTGMSMADSFLGATTLGSAYLPLAGTNAFHQKAKELTEAGEDSATIYKTALASGAAEMIFEKFSLDHFLKIKNVDDIGRIVKNTLVQAGIEGSEELATEISNIITDSAIRGENSELSQYRLQLLKSGLTEKEADIEVAKRIGSQVTWAGIGGALSGAGMGFAGGVGNYAENASTGSMVKGNERVQDLFDIANNPEMASAYETYTRYANKGINTDNVSNAQLGRLYNEVKTDAVEKFNSKKSTAEQRQRGLETLAKLSIVETENEIRKEAKEKHNIGEETKITESGESFNVNDMKIKGDKVTVSTENGEVSVDDTTLAQNDAEIVTLAQRISESDGEAIANLFLSQYDGKANPLEYANSFNLTMEYSKKNFSFDTILQRKGVLSAGQVAELYKETRIKADRERTERIRKLNEEMAGKKSYKGFINESVIDYDNTSAEGKINWNSLSAQERQAITFIKGIAQATGMNLILEHNPKSNYNGRFSVQGNTITLDVKAGIGQAEKFVSTLIPTMSHETTHWMKEKSPELWTSLNNIVFSTLVEHYNLDAEQSIKDKIKLLDRLDPRIKHSEEDAKGRTITEEDLIQAEYQRLVAREKKAGRKINKDALMDEAREEIIARACEDMLSMSKQGRKIFNSLSESEQKTLYEKIKGLINDLLTWVDELLKTYNSKSTEARIMRMYQEKLNEASKVWDEMLEQSVKANQSLEKSGAYNHKSVGEGDNRYSIIETPDGIQYVVLDKNLFIDTAGNELTPRQAYNSLVGQKIMLEDGDVITFVKKLPGNKDIYSELFRKYPAFNDNINIKAVSESINKNIVETISASKISNRNEKQKHNHLGVVDFDSRKVYVTDGNEAYELKLSIANLTDGNKIAYTKSFIEKVSADILAKIKKAETTRKTRLNQLSNNSILNPDENVNKNISTKDSTGRELSEGQQKYFKDSTVRDENGNLLVMYRGDLNEFTVFDRKKTKHSNLYGRGFYFTNSKAHAEQYGESREFYLDIKNPLSPKQNAITKKQMLNFLMAIENDGEDYDLYNYGQDATAESVLNSVWGKGDFEMLQDISASAIGDLVAAVELFNEVNGTNYDGIILPTETVTFNSEQAKLTSNLNPTENEDMRYSEKDIENDLYEELFGVPGEDEAKLSNQIDTWLQGKMKSNEVFDLGRTPAVLKELGAMDLPIVMAQEVLSKINGVKHDVSLENIRNLPKDIADPLMIFKSASVLNAFVILTEMEDMSGRPIIAALHLNKEEKHIRVNRITSVYGKDGIKNFINSQTKLGNLKYIDKIKSQNWSQSRGLQLPKLADTNPDNNIILYKEDIVNKYYMQNSRELLSDKDESVYDIMGETERIIKENEQFRADIDRLKERLEIEKKVTHGNHFNQNHLGAVAGHLRNISKSNMDKVELMKALKDVYSFIAHSENMTWEEVFSKCSVIAKNMLSSAKPEIEVDNYSKDILRDIRNKKISFSDTQKKEAQYIFGKNWNRNFFGRANVTDSGISLEHQWQEWADLYPHLFDRNISDADMPGELYNIIGNLQDASETILEYDEAERVRWLAREIYNQYWNVSPIRTTADKYDKRIKMLNFEHRKAMSEFRNEYKERLEGQKLADDIYYGKKLSEQRENFNSKLAERNAQIQRHKELYNKLRERKDNEIAIAKQHGKDLMSEYKERAERKTLMHSILATTTSLNKKLVTNSKESHIPETLKPVVINLINAIDFSSKQLLGMDGSRKDRRGTPTHSDIALDNTFGRVKSMADDSVTLKQSIQDALEMFEKAEKVATNTSDGTVDLSLIALDVDLKDSIKSLIITIDVLEKNYGTKFTLQQMELDSLKTLNAMVKSISNWASKADTALSMKHKERISVSGEETCEENDVLGKRKQYIESVESFKNFFSWSNLTPVNAFKRLGKAAMKYFDSLRDAQDELTFHQEEIIRFTDKLFEGKLKDIRKWREEVKEFDLTLPNGKSKTVRMPVSYVMSLYCVAKQEDAQRHLYGMDENGNRYDNNGGGMTIAPFKEKKSIEVSEDIENTIMTESLVKKITGTLTEEQRHIADELQKFMNTKGSEWCDAVSMALYGIKKFDIENYFPITVSPNTIKVLNPQDKRQSIHFFSILNYGFTKSRNPNAKQSIEIGDIFDIFANHMSMAAIYSAYALPIYDVVRWYNYKGENAEGKEIGVITSIQKAFGKSATTYIGRLISDLNGQHEASRLGFVTKIFKNTKLAMVGNSISVALLQPTAYLKAMTKIPVRYLLKSALYVKDFGAKKGVEKAKKWCGIALWKSRNNFDTDISKSVTSEMLHDEKWHEKLKEWSLKGASKLDEMTWGVLWNACEFDVRANRKDLKVGSDEFYEEIAYRLRDVIYETQVVDSPLTRSDLMRSPDNLAKMLTMFGSEMTVAYNMVSEAFVDAKLYTKRNGKKGAFKRNAKSIGIALTAYTLTSAASQILNTMVQVLRDDEDKEPEEIMKMYFSNFFADWLIFGKIPYIKEFLNYAQGYSASRPDTLWLDSTVKSVKYWAKAFEGKEGIGEKAIKESLKALSYLSGVPGYNLYRDLMATMDKLGILTAEDFSKMIDDLFD